jgi:threonine/homoserine/homoserine lactone efflux protein
MRWELFVSFLSAALIVQLVPGPGMLFILANGIAGGPRAGVAAACGAATGMVFHTFAAALGLAALFSQAPAAYDALRIAGGLYLLWLAIGHFRSASSALATEPGERPPARRVFVRAWLNNLANPKVILFYIAFLPQFVAPGPGSATLQLIVLGFVFLLLGLVIDLALGVFSGRVGEWLRRRPSFRKGIDRLAGTVMGALGIRLLVSGRRA